MGSEVKGRHKLPRRSFDAEESNEFRCPRCGAPINWTVHGGKAGSKGYAHCSRSIHATQIWRKGSKVPDFCIWQGEAERLPDGNVTIWDDMSWTKHPVP
jgi:hypothetical protein